MEPFQFGGHFSSFRSMADKSLRLTFDTQEATPELMASLQNSFQKTCVLAVSPDNFTSEYLREMENIKVDYEDGSKSPAQRLRGVFYRLWQQNPAGYKAFNDYYNSKMENLLNHYKEQLM